jgi:hypothetical protein
MSILRENRRCYPIRGIHIKFMIDSFFVLIFEKWERAKLCLYHHSLHMFVSSFTNTGINFQYVCIYGDFNTAVTDPGCFVPLHLKVCLYVLNATFNNISAISWQSVLVVEEAGVPGENHRPWASNWQTLSLVAASRVRLVTYNITVLYYRYIFFFQELLVNFYYRFRFIPTEQSF